MIPIEWANDVFLLLCACVGAVALLVLGAVLWYFDEDGCF